MKNMYVDGQYMENNPTWHDEESTWKADHIINLIKRNNLNPQTICDIGCGAGGILDEMSLKLKNKIKFYGYEISPQAFEICKKKEKENLTFVLGNWPDKASFFDVVMALDVLEHVEDYFGFLRELKDKGTYKIFHIPLEINVPSVLNSNSLLHTRKAVGHLHYFTKETALATLEDTGYNIIDCCFTNYPLDCPPPGLKNNLLRIPRTLYYRYRPDLGAIKYGDYNLAVLTK